MRTKTNFLRIVLAIHICMVCTTSNAQKAEIEVESFKQGYFLFEVEPDGKSVSIEWNRELEISGHVEIPSKVTNCSKEYIVRSIEDSAFSDCYDITSLSIPATIEEIGWDAFDGCINISELNILSRTPLNYLSIFENTVWYDNLPDGPICFDTMFAGFKGKPLGTFNVKEGTTAICSHAFYGCIGLTNIIIPNSVTLIGNGAFQGCTGLTSVTIPSSVTSIDDNAFEDCRSLSSVTIPNSITRIGDGAFSGCTGLNSITIPSSVTSIDDNAFEDCRSLSSITIPNSVATIGRSAFAECTGLTSITISSRVTSIDADAFEGCSSLTSVTIPNSVTRIGYGAFKGCTELNSITIPSSVTSIDADAFACCSSLTSVTIPNSVSKIGDRVFSGCNSLSEVRLPNSLTTIGLRVFEGCEQLKSISIPESVVLIGKNAFEGCNSLTTINCIKAKKEIGIMQILQYYKVYDYDIKGLKYHIVNDNHDLQICDFEEDVDEFECYIPSQIDDYSYIDDNNHHYFVTSIASKVFSNCKKLQAIYIPNEVRDISNDAFRGCANLEYIFIPLGSLGRFRKIIPTELWTKLCERNFSEVENYEDIVSTGGIAFTAPEILRDYGDDNYEDDNGEMDDGIKPVYSQSEPVVYNVKGNDEDDFAEETPIAPKASSNEVYDVVEEMPQFPDGPEALMEYINKNIKYPADAKKAGIQGRVICNFVVERDGSITDIKVDRSVDPSLDKEAVRVIRSMPQWIPGKQDGVPVRVKYCIPVTFKL